MKNTITILLVAGSQFAFNAWAQTSAEPHNVHKEYDQKLLACRKQANEQQLKGEDARKFIANCMRAN